MIDPVHYIKTVCLNLDSSNEERGKILDDLGHGCRVIFLDGSGTKRKVFITDHIYETSYYAVVFERHATDDDIKIYLENKFECDETELAAILKFNDLAVEQFLEKYANYVPSTEEYHIQKLILEKFRASYNKEDKEVLIGKLMGFLDSLSVETLAKMYKEKFVK